MTANKELHTYLALMGNQRLPHLEEEIFADNTALEIYLINLCKEYKWYDASDYPAMHAHLYAYYIISSRWPPAESLISSKSHSAYAYAISVIHDKWILGEASILTSAEYTYKYIVHVLEQPWPCGESIISTRPEFKTAYKRFLNNY